MTPPRRLGPDDLEDVLDLLTASDTAVLGRPDFSREEIAADLARADLEAYGWYAGDTLVGYGWVAQTDGAERIDVDAYVRPGADDRLGSQVLAHVEQRGVALAAAAGHEAAIFDVGAYRQDGRTQEWLREHGFTTGTSFVRMRIDLDGPVEPQPLAPGLVLRRVTGSESDLRAAHRIQEESFREHYSHVSQTFDTWRERLTASGADWSDVWLAEVDGEPAGVLVGTRQFEPDENAGYVRTLGVLAATRGRGAGTALLRAYFAEAQRAGRSAVLLHVDVANVTDALRLYESVGMRAVLTIDAWTKRSPVPPVAVA